MSMRFLKGCRYICHKCDGIANHVEVPCLINNHSPQGKVELLGPSITNFHTARQCKLLKVLFVVNVRGKIIAAKNEDCHVMHKEKTTLFNT